MEGYGARLSRRDPFLDLNQYLQDIVASVQQLQNDLATVQGSVSTLTSEVFGTTGIKNKLAHLEGSFFSVCNEVATERRQRRAQGLKELGKSCLSAFLGRYFDALRKHARGHGGIERRLRAQAARATEQFVSRYFTMWRRFHRWAVGRSRRVRALRWLRIKADQSLLHRCFSSLAAHRIRAVEAANKRRQTATLIAYDLEEIVQHCLLRRYLIRLVSYHRARTAQRKRWKAVAAHADQASRAVLQRYWTKLKRYRDRQRGMRKRCQITAALGARQQQAVKAEYWRKWVTYQRAWSQLLKRHKACKLLQYRSELAVVRSAMSKWRRFVDLRHHARERAEYLARIHDVSHRCETLGTQVDVGLKTLTNTNSVLNKLVDRFITIDEQLESLEREKVGRQELGGLADSQQQNKARARSPKGESSMVAALSTAKELLEHTPMNGMVDNLMKRQRELDAAAAAACQAAAHRTPTPEVHGPYEHLDREQMDELLRLDRNRIAARDYEPQSSHRRQDRFPEHYDSTRSGSMPSAFSEAPTSASYPTALADPVSFPSTSSSSARNSVPPEDFRRQQEAVWASHFATIQRTGVPYP
eukprot:Sspe_Gene.112613::Locus_95686_Transcript_1_1_Confidence_1.000_Length_1833::g.112613::m.112613